MAVAAAHSKIAILVVLVNPTVYGCFSFSWFSDIFLCVLFGVAIIALHVCQVHVLSLFILNMKATNNKYNHFL